MDFRITETKTPDAVVENYRAEWELSDEAIKGMVPGDKTRKWW